MVTFAPSSASVSAIARPIPADAPQTIAVRPFRPRSTSAPSSALTRQDPDDVPDRVCGGAQQLLLLVREVELDDLLDPARAELDRDAHVEAVDAVLALEVRRHREHALLVQQDGVDHLRARGPRGVPGRGAEQLDDLAAADGRPLHQRLEPLLRDELRQRDSAHGCRRDDRHHLVAVAAEHERLHVLDGRACLPRDERPEARRVEDAGLAEDALLRQSGSRLRPRAHGVGGVRQHDHDRLGRLRDRLLGDRADDRLVLRHQVVAAHPGLARQAGGDHDHVRAGRLLVAVRPGDRRLEAEDRAHLVDVERLALRQALLDVGEHDVGVVAPREHLRAGRARVPRPDDRDLPPALVRPELVAAELELGHTRTASFSTIASATSLVPTAVGSSRVGFMSYVTLRPSRMTSAIASSSRSAASASPRCRSISIPESICAIGLTLFWPAYLGAEPWVGSKMAMPSPKLAPGAMPRPPIIPAARSETTSP